jgi:3-oxoisoapionate decarboxylase
MRNLKIGIDNYGLHPLGLTPLETLQWAEKNHAQGVQFSGLTSDKVTERDDFYLRKLADYASENNLYIE